MAVSPEEAAGTVIDGRYRLIAEIGAGGMGRVYEAEHMFLRRRMALKLLRGGQGSEAAARMVQEATLAGQVPHPAIVRVFDCADLGGGRVYVAMELLRGETLEQALRRPGRAAEILPWLADVARGLAAAHRVGVVHRDVKPANILLAREEAGAVQAKLLDFGVAKLLPGAGGSGGVQTEAGAVLGTPYYLAPEQARGAALDGRADLYGLGVIMYEALTGALPFVGEGFMAILAQQLHTPPLDPRQAAPERGIPDGVALLTMRLLAKDPVARPADGDAVAEAIAALLTSEGAALGRLVTGPRVGTIAEGSGAGTVRLADGLAEGTGAGTVRAVVDGLAEGTAAKGGTRVAAGTGARRAMVAVAVIGVIAAGIGWMVLRGGRGAEVGAERGVEEAVGSGASGAAGRPLAAPETASAAQVPEVPAAEVAAAGATRTQAAGATTAAMDASVTAEARPEKPRRPAAGKKSSRDSGTTRAPAPTGTADSPRTTNPGDPPLKTDVYDE